MELSLKSVPVRVYICRRNTHTESKKKQQNENYMTFKIYRQRQIVYDVRDREREKKKCHN